MDRSKAIRILRFGIIGVALLTLVLFALGFYTLITGLVGAISSGAFRLELDKDGPSGCWALRLDANPRNNGLLEERLVLGIGLLDSNGKYIVVNSTSVSLAPGEKLSFSLTLTIPYETVRKYNLNATKGADVVFELVLGIRTLDDLVGFQQTMRITGSAGL
ncbi:MAG: hypothetical protein QXD45_00135 [Candidatus Bathyarchaeia archaeon]